VKLNCKFLPTGRKTAQNFVDRTIGLMISLVWREAAERRALTGSPGGGPNAETEAENAGQIIRGRGGSMVAAEGEKWRAGASPGRKMLFNDERSRNVY